MNLQVGLLDDKLITCAIKPGREFTIDQYPSGQFRCIDGPDRQLDNGLVWTPTRSWTDDPEPLLTLSRSVSINLSCKILVLTGFEYSTCYDILIAPPVKQF